MEDNLEYLGDGLYVKFDGYQVYLMANSHITPSDTVALDPHVLRAFLQYVKRINEKKAEEDANK